METDYKDSVINFRVPLAERRKLKIHLINKGLTFQDFFAEVVRQELGQESKEKTQDQEETAHAV